MKNFKNRTIWTGDNLPVLRGINSNSIDLIYLDPPFNSNKSYSAPIGSKSAGAAFKDTWTLSDLDVAWLGLIADEYPAIHDVLQATRSAHGKSMQSYLCMMAVRLIEMHRILKDTGSLYLHCDPTASHYLKILLDAIFTGQGQFRNEVVWERTAGRSDAGNFARVHDVILRYVASDNPVWNNVYQPLSKEYIDKTYRYIDNRGQYRTAPLHGGGISGRTYTFEWKGFESNLWRFPRHRIVELDTEDRIHYGKVPSRKSYLADSKGVAARDVITDIGRAKASERTGYPTQKPRQLLERIITASSNKGDIVLDPFAGCATTCAAAEYLDRQWIGIDLSPLAYTLIQDRLANELKLSSPESPRLTDWKVHHRKYPDLPVRSDIDKLLPYTTHKHTLFGQQEGRCGGCHMDFPFKLYEVDHIVPQSKGGTDDPKNLQLLCGHCNKTKGSQSQAYLKARLQELGYLS